MCYTLDHIVTSNSVMEVTPDGDDCPVEQVQTARVRARLALALGDHECRPCHLVIPAQAGIQRALQWLCFTLQ